MTPLPPIVPLADLVAELRAMHSIPCLTAADRLEEMAGEIADQARHWRDAYDHIDALRPLCLTCGGSGDLLDLICDNCGASASLPLGQTCSNHLAKPSPCPDCVDGHVTWQRCVNVFNAVWDGDYDEPMLGRQLYDRLRAVR